MNNGNINNNNKTNTNRVRPVARVLESATPQVVYDIPFSSIIEAWIDCERNKRTSNSCTKFRWHAARDLVELWQQMRTGQYTPHASMVFIVTYPVLREVWAGAFRDRVVHHWEHLRYQPVLENYFILAGDRSMNCRKGYGSLRAVDFMKKAILEFTEGYTRGDCWIIGGDFSNFFLGIDKDILWPALEHIIMDEYTQADKSALLYMMRTTLYHRCQDNYFRKSPISMWDFLPKRKSLFYMHGIPIGNLPSQNWANFLGAIFTMWLIYAKQIEGFMIFVDDWRCLVRTEEEGRKLITEIKEYLATELHITLHPDKIYLQHYTKGTKMVGAVIKPPCYKPHHVKFLRKWMLRGLSRKPVVPRKFCKFLISAFRHDIMPKPLHNSRTYISNRTRGHFIDTMMKYKKLAECTNEKGRIALLEKLRASVNSYLGMMIHFNSYRIRKRIAEEWILPTWGKYIYFSENFASLKIKKAYDRNVILRHKLKNHRFAAKFIRPKWQGEQ